MKTPEQWLAIINQRANTTQPAGTLKLIQEIQDDAASDHVEEIKRLKSLLEEIKSIAENNFPCGGIGEDGPTLHELNLCAESGKPFDDEANYDAAQRIWRTAEKMKEGK